MDFSSFDIDDLQKYFRRAAIESQNRQTERQDMIDDIPPPNPYAGGGGGKKGILGTIGAIAAPLMKIGGSIASAAGYPYIGVPLSVAGGAVGGASGGEGMAGALGGAVNSGMGQAAGYGFDAMKTPIDNSVSVGEVGKTGGMTIPGRRMEAVDLSSRNMTAPASPKSFGGGMS